VRRQHSHKIILFSQPRSWFGPDRLCFSILYLRLTFISKNRFFKLIHKIKNLAKNVTYHYFRNINVHFHQCRLILISVKIGSIFSKSFIYYNCNKLFNIVVNKYKQCKKYKYIKYKYNSIYILCIYIFFKIQFFSSLFVKKVI